MKGLIKSTVIALVMVGCVNTYASMQDCGDAGINLNKSNYEKAIKYCKPYAESNPKAALILGGGYVFKRDYSLAEKYIQQGINYYNTHPESDDNLNQGISAAYGTLGNLYYFGQGLPKNTQKGLEYITKGAELGNTTAQKQLGDIYTSNKNITQNLSVAYQWYEISILNGDSEANDTYVISHLDQMKQQLPACLSMGQDNVGQAYYQGIGGLEQSNSKALDWMQKAADTDPTLSVTNLDLAKMYHINGDDDKAFEYAQKATSQPLAQAMQYLGTLYQQGAGTDKNSVKAYAYLTLAVDLYNNPDTDFWSKFAAPCMPNYQGTTKEFNVDVAKQQLEQISLNNKQNGQANKIVEQVKAKFTE